MDDEWSAAMAEQGSIENAEKKENSDNVENAPLDDLSEDALSNDENDEQRLNAILDSRVSSSMEVGRTNISIRDLLKLSQGSVVELERLAGESLDVLVNGTLIAHGEVVVVNEKFGIRLTDVISQTERIKKLR